MRYVKCQIVEVIKEEFLKKLKRASPEQQKIAGTQNEEARPVPPEEIGVVAVVQTEEEEKVNASSGKWWKSEIENLSG